MISGVYQLDFGNMGCYIGKSIDIERRWEEHIKSLHEGKSAKKLQTAYNQYGVPSRSILVTCHPDHIGLVETIMIHRLKPSLNSAATISITDEDFDILDCNLDNLNLSTAQLLYNTYLLGKQVKTLETEIEFLLDDTDVANSLYTATQRIRDLTLTNVGLIQHIQKLEEQTSKPWYKKLS